VRSYNSRLSPLSLTSIFVVSSFGRAVLEGQGRDFEDFAFFIPPDCPTSTPVASRMRASRNFSAESGTAAPSGVDSSLAKTRAIEATRQ
jgi:hypothetical protein